MAKSKARMTTREKERIETMLKQDLMTIEMTMVKQLQSFYDAKKVMLTEQHGIAAKQQEAENLREDILKAEKKLQKLREELQFQIDSKRQELKRIEGEALGKFNAPPSVDQLRELGFNEDTPIRDRSWYGFPVRTSFDALICIELKKDTNVEAPARTLKMIADSVMRSMAFAASYEDVENVYEKFYSLDFRRYGVEITPRLDDLVKLSGNNLLGVGVVEDPTRRLEAAKAAEERLEQVAQAVAVETAGDAKVPAAPKKSK